MTLNELRQQLVREVTLSIFYISLCFCFRMARAAAAAALLLLDDDDDDDDDDEVQPPPQRRR